MLPRRGWVGWIEEHSKALGALSVWAFVTLGGIGALVASTSGNHGAQVAIPGGTSSSSAPAPVNSGGAPAGPKGSGGKTGPNKTSTGPSSSSTGTGPSGSGGTQPTTPQGGAVPQPGGGKCTPTQPKAANGSNETGITTGSVTIGEILSDVSQLPQQFHPTYEGLSAWADLVNHSGGICGRKIAITERNDQALPNNYTSDYQSMSSSVFAFVANQSLQDGAEYQSNPPYRPNNKDPNTGEYVPDIGGLALQYPRAQSPMHWGVFGSLSPTLVGGGAYHQMTSTSPGTKCKKGGVVYLDEPTGASKDQATIGGAALKASWGGGLAYNFYHQPLEAQEAQWSTTVQQMISDGVNCVFTYADAGSNVNLLSAMAQNQVWPPNQCSATRKTAGQCFQLVYMPFTSVDANFVRNAGSAGSQVTSYIPHLPLNETSKPAVKAYMDALAQCKKDGFAGCGSGTDQPSTFSVIGFDSGVMFGQALAACGAAPTRGCVESYLNKLQGFTANGLQAPISPAACIKVKSGSGPAGSYNGSPWCFKEIFNHWVMIRELGSPSQGIDAFRRIYPNSAFAQDALHIVRGSPG